MRLFATCLMLAGLALMGISFLMSSFVPHADLLDPQMVFNMGQAQLRLMVLVAGGFLFTGGAVTSGFAALLDRLEFAGVIRSRDAEQLAARADADADRVKRGWAADTAVSTGADVGPQKQD
jgi:hypothetical protein